MHVLVVDDDLDTGDLLKQALKNEGYRVSYASSAAAALRHVRTQQDVDVVLVDMHPAKPLSGMALVRELRKYLGRTRYVLASGEWDALEPHCQQDTTILRQPYGKKELLRALGRCSNPTHPSPTWRKHFARPQEYLLQRA